MYVCTYLYIYIYIYKHIYKHIYTCIYISTAGSWVDPKYVPLVTVEIERACLNVYSVIWKYRVR